MAKPHNFSNGELYHIYNRGTDKRKIFLDKRDYDRFLFGVTRCNSPKKKIKNSARDFNSSKSKEVCQIENLVRIHAYCLMPNHYHLIVEQLIDNGISKFLQKSMTGYTMFFNTRHKRSGVLFQGKTKSRLIDSDRYLMWLKSYIALNPLDLCEPGWKEKGVKSEKVACKFLEQYGWRSSFDYSEFKKYLSSVRQDYEARSDLASFIDKKYN